MNISKLKLVAIILLTVFASVEGTLLTIQYSQQHTMYCSEFPAYAIATKKDTGFTSLDHIYGYYVTSQQAITNVYGAWSHEAVRNGNMTLALSTHDLTVALKAMYRYPVYFGTLHLESGSYSVVLYGDSHYNMQQGDMIAGLYYQTAPNTYYIFVCS